jgi:sugar lactone lactonase YvrE
MMRVKTTLTALLASLFVALFFSACGIDQKGMVLLKDESYRATIFSTNKNGIGAPDGLLWRQDKLFIADEGGSALRVWSANGIQTLCDAKLGVMSPEDVVMDATGNLFFSDDDAGGVWQIAANGQASLLAGKDKGLLSTEAIALAPSGEILVGDGIKHQVFSVSRTGDVSVFLGSGYGIRKPESMVFDEAGNLYIADNEEQIVYLLTPEMKLQRLLEKRENFAPETLWYAHGTLFITDSSAGKLYRFTPADGLQTIAVFGGKLATVNGLTMDEQGSLYVSVQTDLKRKIGYIVKLEREPQP